MQSIDTTSFFPTATEVSGGIKWIREHPVIATATAAAATAVSVITYLRRNSQGQDQLQHVVSWSNPTGECVSSVVMEDGVEVTSSKKTQEEERDEEEEQNPPKQLKRTKSTLESQQPDRSQPVDSKCSRRIPGAPDDIYDGYNEASPQWGWYVAITPPQENYSETRPANAVLRRVAKPYSGSKSR